jgi:hypothetical protein
MDYFDLKLFNDIEENIACGVSPILTSIQHTPAYTQ